MDYLEVANWSKNQTYRKDRGTPPWIKVKRSLLSSAKWARLSDAQKGQMLSIWLVAAERDGRIPADPTILRKVCALDDAPDVELFVELGFLVPSGCHDGNQLTTTCQPDDRELTSAETETETETETEAEREGTARKKRSEKRSYPVAAEAFFEFCSDHGAFAEALDWLEVLKRKKAALTELAWSRRLAKIERMAANESVAEILSRSADAGWSDLYERSTKRSVYPKGETNVQRRQREAREALGS